MLVVVVLKDSAVDRVRAAPGGDVNRRAAGHHRVRCATYRDAANLADRYDSMIEWGHGALPVRLKGDDTRDEDEQARFISQLLDIFRDGGR
jgi:hypothetical protein